jgi:hypothetical protein
MLELLSTTPSRRIEGGDVKLHLFYTSALFGAVRGQFHAAPTKFCNEAHGKRCNDQRSLIGKPLRGYRGVRETIILKLALE